MTNTKQDLYKIETKDCISALRELSDNSIDLVVTSPPYRDKDGYSESLMENLAMELSRVIKEGGKLFINFGQLSPTPNRPWEVANIFNKYFDQGNCIAWIKSLPELGGNFTPVQGSKWLNRKWEPVFIFSKETRCLDRLAIGVPYRDKSNTTRFKHGRNIQCAGDAWFIPYPTRTGPKLHKDEMPVELAKRCILLANITSGQTVLDPFVGSGTTGVACKIVNPKIKFIGFDYNEKNVAISKQRIGLCEGD